MATSRSPSPAPPRRIGQTEELRSREYRARDRDREWRRDRHQNYERDSRRRRDGKDAVDWRRGDDDRDPRKRRGREHNSDRRVLRKGSPESAITQGRRSEQEWLASSSLSLSRHSSDGQGLSRPSEPPIEKEKPDFGNTGLLAAASNTLNNIALKYSEPSDSRKPPPSPAWKLFVFKDTQIVDTLTLSTQTCWLIGRDRAVVDLPVDHPSCSKQHAVLQFRFVSSVDEVGDRKSGVKLYVMDLDSANGTKLGDLELEGRRFVEVRDGDLIRFGLSTREYVVMLDEGRKG